MSEPRSSSKRKMVIFIVAIFGVSEDVVLLRSFSRLFPARSASKTNHPTQSPHGVTYQSTQCNKFRWFISAQPQETSRNKAKEGEKVDWHKKRFISSFPLNQHLSVFLVRVESDTIRQAIRVFGTEGGGEGRRGSLLSSDLSRLEPGNKVFDCLVLEVGAHVTGEGPICVPLFCGAENTQWHAVKMTAIFSIILRRRKVSIIFWSLK